MGQEIDKVVEKVMGSVDETTMSPETIQAFEEFQTKFNEFFEHMTTGFEELGEKLEDFTDNMNNRFDQVDARLDSLGDTMDRFNTTLADCLH